MLKSPAKINSLLLSPKDAATNENSVIKAFMCSFSIFGGLYIFPIVNVFDKLPPFTFIINPSQCSYELRLIITSALYLSSIYITSPPLLLLLLPCVIQNLQHKLRKIVAFCFPCILHTYHIEFKIDTI